MNTINLSKKSFIKYKSKKTKKYFILLGSESIRHKRFMRKIIHPKLKKEYKNHVPGFWGTLGFADSMMKSWEGKLLVSEYGNDNLKGIGKDMAEHIKHIYELSDEDRIIERFIAFDNSEIKFPEGNFTKDEIPKMRLTIMLRKKESAVVIFQHKDAISGNEYYEFIMPEATSANNLNKRDRLSYYFDAVPKNEVEAIDKLKGLYKMSDKPSLKQFLIKVITFERQEFKDSDDFLNFIKKKTFCKGENRTHCLLKFNPEENDFHTADIVDIDPLLKTLFLIHGTFASTGQSFKALYKGENEWLKKQMVQNNGTYEQIIAFDHPTVTDDAVMNTEVLFNMLGDGFKFEHDADVLATSQGGLFAQYLANYPADETKIPVGKVALLASANGVDYFKTGELIPKFLTIMSHILKDSGRAIAAYIVGLASQSAEYFLNLPGSLMMTPGRPELDQIMDTEPANSSTCYLPLIDDFDKNSEIDSEFMKIVLSALSVAVYPIMGKYNDLVVRTKNQYKIHKEYCCIPNYDPENFKDQMVSSLHGKALEIQAVKDRIENFLKNNDVSC